MSHTKRLCAIVALFLFHSTNVEPYGFGAPSSACKSMTPGHGSTPQTIPSPYSISPNINSVSGGDRITVKVQSNSDPFKGFFIQARESTGIPVGTFHSNDHNVITCGDDADNAVTHRSPDLKTSVELEWEAPLNFEGAVLFTATVVNNFTTYWTSLESANNVNVKKRSLRNLGSSGIQDKLTDLYTGCGSTKSCYGSTEKCVKNKDCNFLVTYTDAGNDKYEFELLGRKNRDKKYVAVGLSMDATMGSDGVVVCANENGVIHIYHSWNDGKSNIAVSEPKRGLTVLQTGEIEGSTYCRFHRNAKTRIGSTNFDLSKEKYHIMLAEGSIDSNGRIQYHNTNRLVSSSPVSLGVTSNLKNRDTRLFRAIHGSLMIGAWICAASCGILFARYYKKTWLRFKRCNIDQWFHFHRLFMVTTWSLTICAFILIVVELKEFRPTTHAIVGVCSVGLCFIQPFMAALRPGPNGKNRPLFNWAHWLVGNAAQILGITAIFFGFDLFLSGEDNWLKRFAWYVVVAFIAFHCLTHIVLSITQCFSDKKKTEVGDVFPLKEFAADSRSPLHPVEKIEDAPLGGFRKVVLAIYLILNWCVTTLLILIVVFTREQIETQWEAWNFSAFWED